MYFKEEEDELIESIEDSMFGDSDEDEKQIGGTVETNIKVVQKT